MQGFDVLRMPNKKGLFFNIIWATYAVLIIIIVGVISQMIIISVVETGYRDSDVRAFFSHMDFDVRKDTFDYVNSIQQKEMDFITVKMISWGLEKREAFNVFITIAYSALIIVLFWVDGWVRADKKKVVYKRDVVIDCGLVKIDFELLSRVRVGIGDGAYAGREGVVISASDYIDYLNGKYDSVRFKLLHELGHWFAADRLFRYGDLAGFLLVGGAVSFTAYFQADSVLMNTFYAVLSIFSSDLSERIYAMDIELTSAYQVFEWFIYIFFGVIFPVWFCTLLKREREVLADHFAAERCPEGMGFDEFRQLYGGIWSDDFARRSYQVFGRINNDAHKISLCLIIIHALLISWMYKAVYWTGYFGGVASNSMVVMLMVYALSLSFFFVFMSRFRCDSLLVLLVKLAVSLVVLFASGFNYEPSKFGHLKWPMAEFILSLNLGLGVVFSLGSLIAIFRYMRVRYA